MNRFLNQAKTAIFEILAVSYTGFTVKNSTINGITFLYLGNFAKIEIVKNETSLTILDSSQKSIVPKIFVVRNGIELNQALQTIFPASRN